MKSALSHQLWLGLVLAVCGGWTPTSWALSPDLTILSLTHTPLSPTTNSQVMVTAVVRNIGLGAAGPSVLTVQATGDSSPTRYNVPALDSMAEHTVNRLIQVTGAGQYQVTAVADADNVLNELNERNNTATDTLAVSVPTADLQVLSLTHAPLSPTTAETVTLAAVVINSGSGDAAPSVLTLRVGNESTPARFEVPSLAANAIHSVTRQVQLGSAQTYEIVAMADADNTVAETNENNNSKTDSLTVKAAQPDLVVFSLTHAPLSPTTAEEVTWSAVVMNTGTAPAGPSVLTLRIGDESVPASYDIPALEPNATFPVNRSQQLASARTYLVTATADATQAVAEADETNNTKTDSVTVKPAQADLIVLSLTHTPLTPTTADPVTFTAVVQNTGTAEAGPSVLTLQLGDATVLANSNVPALAPYAIYTVQAQTQFPSAQNHTLTAIADGTGTVTEADENNNTRTDSVTVKPAQPDLVVASLTHSPLIPTTADTVTFTAVVQNTGPGQAGPSVLTLELEGESVPAVFDVPALAPNARHTVQYPRPLATAQTWTLKATADANQALAETDETNNTKTDTVTVKTPQPDLVLVSLTHTPLTPITADPMTFSVVVQNTGTGEAGPCVLTVRVGNEPTPASYSVPTQAPNAVQTFTRQVALTNPGDYTVTATVDANQSVAESDESNNAKTDSFTVKTPQPDLVLVSLTHTPPTPTTADTMTFAVVIQNTGTGEAGPCDLSVQVSGAPTPATYSVPALAPNAIHTVSHQFALTNPAEYTVTATVDASHGVAESDETNNTKTDSFTVKRPQPDLVLVSLTHTPVTPTTADTMTFTVVVQNTGTGEAGPCVLSVGAGGESTPATYSVPALAPNAARTFTRQLAFPNPAEASVTATVDSGQSVAESDEANNTKTDTFTVKAPTLDLVVLSLTIAPLNPTTLDTVTVTATVQNNGTAQTGPSQLAVTVLGQGGPAYYDVPALAPNTPHLVNHQVSLTNARDYTVVAVADATGVLTETDETNNARTNTFTVALPKPDLIVFSLTHSPLSPTTTNEVTFTAVVQNVGASNAGPSVLTLRVGAESTPTRYSIPALAPNALYATNRQQRLPLAQTCQVVATADADNTVAEANEDNNLKLDTFELTPAGPDLAVVSVSCAPSAPVTSNTIRITTTVKNLGLVPADSCLLSLQIEGSESPASFTVPTLAPGATHAATWEGQLTVPGRYLLTATVDAGQSVVEYDESNNQLTNTLTVTAGTLCLQPLGCSNGVLRVRLTGPGSRAVVSVSADLQRWEDILFYALPPEGLVLELPVGEPAFRFFRARSE